MKIFTINYLLNQIKNQLNNRKTLKERLVFTIEKILDTLLNADLSKKNFGIVCFIMIIAVIYFLKIDMTMLTQIPYITVILLIFGFLITIFCNSLVLSKLDAVSDISDKYKNTDEIIENNVNQLDIIKTKLMEIDDALVNHDKKFSAVANEISDRPNLSTIKIIINAELKDNLNDIFFKCLNYTLMCNENNTDIALQSLKDAVRDSIRKCVDAVHDNIKAYDPNEPLSAKIETKINEMNEVIYKDIQTNKAINEKMYVIYFIIHEHRIEIQNIVLEYLRQIQTQILE